MFYFKSNSTALDADFIRKNSDTEKIKISYDDRKVYCTAILHISFKTKMRSYCSFVRIVTGIRSIRELSLKVVIEVI